MNNFCGVGKVFFAPKITRTPTNTTYAKFIIEIPRPMKDGKDTGKDKINVSAWGKVVDIVKYIELGDLVEFQGPISTSAYQKNGEWVNTWEVVIQKIAVIQRSGMGTPAPQPQPVQQPVPQYQQPPAVNYPTGNLPQIPYQGTEAPPDDGTLPFTLY